MLQKPKVKKTNVNMIKRLLKKSGVDPKRFMDLAGKDQRRGIVKAFDTYRMKNEKGGPEPTAIFFQSWIWRGEGSSLIPQEIRSEIPRLQHHRESEPAKPMEPDPSVKSKLTKETGEKLLGKRREQKESFVGLKSMRGKKEPKKAHQRSTPALPVKPDKSSKKKLKMEALDRIIDESKGALETERITRQRLHEQEQNLAGMFDVPVEIEDITTTNVATPEDWAELDQDHDDKFDNLIIPNNTSISNAMDDIRNAGSGISHGVDAQDVLPAPDQPMAFGAIINDRFAQAAGWLNWEQAMGFLGRDDVTEFLEQADPVGYVDLARRVTKLKTDENPDILDFLSGAGDIVDRIVGDRFPMLKRLRPAVEKAVGLIGGVPSSSGDGVVDRSTIRNPTRERRSEGFAVKSIDSAGPAGLGEISDRLKKFREGTSSRVTWNRDFGPFATPLFNDIKEVQINDSLREHEKEQAKSQFNITYGIGQLRDDYKYLGNRFMRPTKINSRLLRTDFWQFNVRPKEIKKIHAEYEPVRIHEIVRRHQGLCALVKPNKISVCRSLGQVY